MGLAELKVTLAIIRLTIGYQRTKCRASISTLVKMTGLSRYSVLKGADLAQERGTINKHKTTRILEWSVNLVNHPQVKKVNQIGSLNEPPSIKKRDKESINNRKKYNQSEIDRHYQ